MASRARLLGAVLLVLLPSGLAAQRINGRVVDAETRAAAVGVSMEVIDAADSVVVAFETDSTGIFVVDLATGGAYRVRASHLAWAAYTSEAIRVEAGEAVRIEIRLGRNVIPLEPLVIEARSNVGRLAGYRDRLASDPFGKFVTREDIEKRPVSNTTDFLRTIPGVSVLPVNRNNNPSGLITNVIAMRGSVTWCDPAIFLDGARIGQSADSPIDDLIPAEVLEGVEVYTSPGSVPAQYRTDAHCGAVLFWTREARERGPGGLKRLLIGLGALATIFVLAF